MLNSPRALPLLDIFHYIYKYVHHKSRTKDALFTVSSKLTKRLEHIAGNNQLSKHFNRFIYNLTLANPRICWQTVFVDYALYDRYVIAITVKVINLRQLEMSWLVLWIVENCEQIWEVLFYHFASMFIRSLQGGRFVVRGWLIVYDKSLTKCYTGIITFARYSKDQTASNNRHDLNHWHFHCLHCLLRSFWRINV